MHTRRGLSRKWARACPWPIRCPEKKHASGLTVCYVGPGLSCAIGQCALTRGFWVKLGESHRLMLGPVEASAASGCSCLPGAVTSSGGSSIKGGEVPVQRLLPDVSIVESGRINDEEGKCVSYSAPSYMTNSHSASRRTKKGRTAKKTIIRDPSTGPLAPFHLLPVLSLPYKRSRHRMHFAQKWFRARF